MLSKLDKFFISIEWSDLFDPVFVHTLPRVGSDHIPILMKGGEVLNHSGPLPFKFQNTWLLHPRFVELMKGWWEGFVVHGPLGQRFRMKLKGLGDVLRGWNKEVFGEIERKKKYCLDDIQRLDRKEGNEGLDEDEQFVRREAQREFERAWR